MLKQLLANAELEKAALKEIGRVGVIELGGLPDSKLRSRTWCLMFARHGVAA